MAEEKVTFGRKLRDKEFMLDPDSVHVNQGSWGCAPRCVFDAQTRLKEKIEFQPDHHFRRVVSTTWFKSLATACEFINVKPENATFVDNATSGTNNVMKSLPLKPGDQILLYSWTYTAVTNTAHRVAETTGAEVLTMELKYPVKSKEDVVEKYRIMLKSNPKIKLAIIDYIASPTATLFPVEELVKLCKQYDVMSLIDGAHAPGQVDLNIENIMPDFFVGNLHKWVFCPRACSILWINPKHAGTIFPLVTSHSLKSTPWQNDFFKQGTCDNTAHLISPEGIKFYQGLGGREALTEYTSNLLEKAVKLLVDKWGTRRFDIPADMEAPFMRLVRVPDSGYTSVDASEVYSNQDELMKDLYERFNIQAVLMTIQDEPWIRISATAYNYLEEYEKVAEAMLTLVAENMGLNCS